MAAAPGTFGSLRLTRSVLTHLVATGAVAVGDDLIQSVAGGGLLSGSRGVSARVSSMAR